VETFALTISDVTNGTISKARGVATIEASDPRATVQGPTPRVNPPTTKKPDTKPTVLPRMVLGPRTVTVNRGIARMLVTCMKDSRLTCRGTVALERTTKPKLRYGSKKFIAKKGTKTYVQIKLTAAALKLLNTRKTLKVKTVVIVKTSAKDFTASPGVITLKKGKPVLKAKAKPKPKAPSTRVVVDP
jgi:hypothetical protein